MVVGNLNPESQFVGIYLVHLFTGVLEDSLTWSRQTVLYLIKPILITIKFLFRSFNFPHLFLLSHPFPWHHSTYKILLRNFLDFLYSVFVNASLPVLCHSLSAFAD